MADEVDDAVTTTLAIAKGVLAAAGESENTGQRRATRCVRRPRLDRLCT